MLVVTDNTTFSSFRNSNISIPSCEFQIKVPNQASVLNYKALLGIRIYVNISPSRFKEQEGKVLSNAACP